MEELRPGHKVRHYKGDLYIYLDQSLFVTDAKNEVHILYLSLKGERFNRTQVDFYQPVKWPDGVMRPRFTLVEEGAE